MTRRRCLVAVFLGALLAAAPGRAQDLASLGVELEPPGGWTIAVDPAGAVATIVADPADLTRSRPAGPRIVLVVGTAENPVDLDPRSIRRVLDPRETRVGAAAAVSIDLELEGGIHRRIVTTISADGIAYRFVLEAPRGGWPRESTRMEAALSGVAFSPVALAPGAAGTDPLRPDVSTPEARIRAGQRVLAWLECLIADVAAGRRILVVAPDPFGFLPVDPARAEIAIDLALAAGSIDERGTARIRQELAAGQIEAMENALEWRDWLRDEVGRYGTIAPVCSGAGAPPAVASQRPGGPPVAVAPAPRGANPPATRGANPPATPRAQPSTPAAQTSISTLPAGFPSTWQWASAGDWGGTWTRRGESDLFDVTYRNVNGTVVTAVERVSIEGGRLVSRRQQSSDGVLCTIDGPYPPVAGVVEGTGNCPGVSSGWWFRLTAGGGQPAAVANVPPANNPPTGADPPLPADALRTERATFAANEPIRVTFSRLPGTNDWLTIVPAGTPDEQFAEWYWSDGSSTAGRPAGTPRRSGTIAFNGLPPGDYEVRLYLDWPAGGYRVRGRRPITVVAAQAPPSGAPAATPAARTGAAAASPFVGEWRTESNGFVMVVRLWAQGDVIVGTYDYQNGVIENGELSGLLLIFTFRDATGMYGNGQFVLSGDGTTFTGTWMDGSGRTGTWNGIRADLAAAAPPPAAPPAASAGSMLGPDFPTSLWIQFSHGWTGSWTRRGASDLFDVDYRGPAGQVVTAVERIIPQGEGYHIQRVSSSDGFLCTMEGYVTADRTGIEGTQTCPGINGSWGFRLTAGAAPAAQPYFWIAGAGWPTTIRSGAPPAPVSVTWGGTPAFPVRVILAPDSCVGRCETVTRTFTNAVNPLVLQDAAWCQTTGGALTLDYSIVLEDATGTRSAPFNADATCVP